MRTAGPRVAAFLHRYLRHTKGEWAGQPVACEPWQQTLLDHLFAVDDTGRRLYTDALVGIARKNSKSTLCAGIALYMLGPDGEPGPEVYTAGGSAEQAGIVFEQAKAFVDANPALEQWFVPRHITIRLANGSGFLRRLAADGRLNHGLNPHAAIIDELHAFTSPRQEENYTALTTAGGARREPLVVSITTAGADPDTILGRRYRALLEDPRTVRVGGRERERLRAGLTMLRDPDTGRLVMWWGADEDADIEDPAVWRAANPASWIGERYLRAQLRSPDVSEADFRRLHLNQFTKTRAAWLPWGTWAGLVARLEMPAQVAVGVDVGLTQDTTAVAWAAPVEDDGRRRIVVRSHVWSARDDVPHDTFCPGGRVDLAAVEDFIRELARRHDVARVHYDPRFFERSAQTLGAEGLTVAPLVQSSAPMADAYHEWYVDARTGALAHDGDAVLAAHVEATAAVRTERGWKVSKLRSKGRVIDACVAGVMAAYGARRVHESAGEPEPWVGAA